MMCERDLENIRDILQQLADRNTLSRTVNADADSGDIVRCKDLIDQGFKRFEVGIILGGNRAFIDLSVRSTRRLLYEWM